MKQQYNNQKTVYNRKDLSEPKFVRSVTVGVQYLKNYDLNKWGELNYRNVGDSGFDLRAAINSGSGNKRMVIRPCQVYIIPTGVIFDIPLGYEIQIRPRSGFSMKYGALIINSPGTVDSQFRGEVKIIMAGLESIFEIQNGDRIAQAVVCKVPKVNLVKVDEVSKTLRGNNGFGSTGIK